MKTITYRTQGTCSRFIELTGENGVVTDVKFFGGCDGNLQGISKLVKGMKYEDVIARLRGISCNGKPTSCPDQLCHAIEQLMREGEYQNRRGEPMCSPKRNNSILWHRK